MSDPGTLRSLQGVRRDMVRTLASYDDQVQAMQRPTLGESAVQRAFLRRLLNKGRSCVADALQVELLRLEAELAPPAEDRAQPERTKS